MEPAHSARPAKAPVQLDSAEARGAQIPGRGPTGQGPGQVVLAQPQENTEGHGPSPVADLAQGGPSRHKKPVQLSKRVQRSPAVASTLGNSSSADSIYPPPRQQPIADRVLPLAHRASAEDPATGHMPTSSGNITESGGQSTAATIASSELDSCRSRNRRRPPPPCCPKDRDDAEFQSRKDDGSTTEE
ncbi:hypothetical protein Nepgr_013226 [Nepenthes gracilis]|uniref:Uncharacterized protein n=1 Tax=Nepenthes gracilis TaxID=150966 RepID=A0AAD3XP62_NEPGR|nr:hypothetical protein Nepgr_013226 [Nepenthes gracilis]